MTHLVQQLIDQIVAFHGRGGGGRYLKGQLERLAAAAAAAAPPPPVEKGPKEDGEEFAGCYFLKPRVLNDPEIPESDKWVIERVFRSNATTTAAHVLSVASRVAIGKSGSPYTAHRVTLVTSKWRDAFHVAPKDFKWVVSVDSSGLIKANPQVDMGLYAAEEAAAYRKWKNTQLKLAAKQRLKAAMGALEYGGYGLKVGDRVRYGGKEFLFLAAINSSAMIVTPDGKGKTMAFLRHIKPW